LLQDHEIHHRILHKANHKYYREDKDKRTFLKEINRQWFYDPELHTRPLLLLKAEVSYLLAGETVVHMYHLLLHKSKGLDPSAQLLQLVSLYRILLSNQNQKILPSF